MALFDYATAVCKDKEEISIELVCNENSHHRFRVGARAMGERHA